MSTSEFVGLAMWEGSALPEELGCDCKKTSAHRTAEYAQNPITAYAKEYVVGSRSYFETDFNAAFFPLSTSASDQYRLQPTMGLQCPEANTLPGPDPFECRPNAILSGQYSTILTEDMTRRTFVLSARPTDPGSVGPSGGLSPTSHLLLYKTFISTESGMVLKVSCSFVKALIGEEARFGVYLVHQDDGLIGRSYEYHELQGNSPCEYHYVAPVRSKEGHLAEIGLFRRGNAPLEEEELFRCHTLAILPCHVRELLGNSQFNLINLRVIERNLQGLSQKRLAWDWEGSQELWPTDIPWSTTTGPFAHFAIFINDIKVGTSHCMEFPLREEEAMPLQADEMGHERSYTVQGMFFGDLACLAGPAKISLSVQVE